MSAATWDTNSALGSGKMRCKKNCLRSSCTPLGQEEAKKQSKEAARTQEQKSGEFPELS